MLSIFVVVGLSSCKKEDYSNDKRQVVWLASRELNSSLDNNFIIEGFFPTSNGYRMTSDDFHCTYGKVDSVGKFRYESQQGGNPLYQKTFQEVLWISPDGSRVKITLEMIDLGSDLGHGIIANGDGQGNIEKFLECRKEPSDTGESSFNGIYFDESNGSLTGINFPYFYYYCTKNYLPGGSGSVTYVDDTLHLPGRITISCIYIHTNNEDVFYALDFSTTGGSHPAGTIYAYTANPRFIKRVEGY